MEGNYLHIILASGSPRRKELLKLIFSEFDIIVPDVEEIVPNWIDLFEGPLFLACEKASKVAANWPESLVIGSDTGVFEGGLMLGKPQNKEQAKDMLVKLSGKKHKVITGCCVIYKSGKICFSEESTVEFRQLSENEIDEYIKTPEPYDKAGGYAIQGMASSFISSIEGDYNNIVGLPVEALQKRIKMGYNFPC